MGNSLRCCLACVLPCGALDLIRVVHLNGHVEEFTGRVTAGEVLKDKPDHIITKPCETQGVGRRILILSPESELKRGSIYFLIPASSLPDDKSKTAEKKSSHSDKTCDIHPAVKKSSRRRRDRSKSSVELWRPYLESVSEDL